MRAAGTGWRFAKGKQHMDGHRALIYSRVRKNKLDPADTDFSRAERNQQVLNAVAGEADRLRDAAQAAVHRRRPARAARDRHLDAGVPLARLVEVPLERRTTLHCRLGRRGERRRLHPSARGEPRVISGIQGRLGAAAAPPPACPGSGAFGPGCSDREPKDARASVSPLRAR